MTDGLLLGELTSKTRPERIQMTYSPRSKAAKSALRLVSGPAPTSEVRLGGIAPSEEMTPDKYVVRCEAPWLEPVGKAQRAALQFSVEAGPHAGVGLRLWCRAADPGGIVSATGRYAHYCSLALGRPVQGTDDVADPAHIFTGLTFVALVGYRKTDRPRGGTARDENVFRRKDDQDFLRIHDLLSRAVV